jgi:hemerythrin-like domain-containing protein
MQTTRLKRYLPQLEEIQKDYDLFHFVFTVPNVTAGELKDKVKQMFNRFAYMIRYFKGDAKIKRCHFDKYDYVGCVRSLEITFGDKGYHPHIHAIFVMRKGLTFERNQINKFSYSHGKLANVFSKFEIQLQKIWYCLMNEIKVTVDNLDDIQDGYSCILKDTVTSTFYEVFKYATKQFDDKSTFMTYNQFKTIYETLYRRRTIQGYGALYKITDDDEIDEKVLAGYYELQKALKAIEEPKQTSNTIMEVLRNDGVPYRFISRKTCLQAVKDGELEITPEMLSAYRDYIAREEMIRRIENNECNFIWQKAGLSMPDKVDKYIQDNYYIYGKEFTPKPKEAIQGKIEF